MPWTVGLHWAAYFHKYIPKSQFCSCVIVLDIPVKVLVAGALQGWPLWAEPYNCFMADPKRTHCCQSWATSNAGCALEKHNKERKKILCGSSWKRGVRKWERSKPAATKVIVGWQEVLQIHPAARGEGHGGAGCPFGAYGLVIEQICTRSPYRAVAWGKL